MNRFIYALLFFTTLLSCNGAQGQNSTDTTINKTNKKVIQQAELTNIKVKNHVFLDAMYKDAYFPNFLVDKCRNILEDKISLNDKKYQ